MTRTKERWRVSVLLAQKSSRTSPRGTYLSIDFDDLFIGIDEGDMLPDLEMDPEILADLPTSRCDVEESMNTSGEKTDEDSSQRKEEEEEEDKTSGSGSGSSSSKGEEVFSKREESNAVKGRKSSAAQAKNNHQGKRKTKVDWTPELHRRFVQAVEQLGVDKAVPSRIYGNRLSNSP